MKYLFAALSGMVITLCVFIGGAAFAITYLTAERLPVQQPLAEASAPTFPSQPVRVNPVQRETEFERVESQPAPQPVEPEIEIDNEPALQVDNITTASIAEPEDQERTAPNDAHVAWCREQYQSYRSEDNTYTSYRGDARECVSPYSEGSASTPDEEGIYIEASAGEASYASASGLSPEHIESCFARYRSYSPEDNTYQPYGGGPRQQCE